MLRRLVLSIQFGLLLVAFLGSGCGKSMYVIDVRDNLAKWKGPRTPAPPARKPGSIAVQVVGSPTMGFLADPFEPRPKLVPVLASEDDEKKAFKQMLDANQTAIAGGLIRGVGEAARAILQQHLARHFERADVQLVPHPTAGFPGPTVTDLQLSIIVGFYTRTAAFSWVATVPGGQPMTAQATAKKANAAGHLAWGIPLSLITFPLGLAITSAVMSSVYSGMEEAKTVEAIDQAAASLAAQLANGPTS